MSRIEFETDSVYTMRPRGEGGGLSTLVQKYSFGLIKTQKGTEAFLLVLFLVLVACAVMILNGRDVVEVKQPDETLINAAQPVKPL